MRNISFESLEETHFTPGQAGAYAERASHTAAIVVGRSTIAVRFSRASAATVFAERFGDMLADRTPDVVVHAVDLHGEAYFWLAPERVRRWPHDASDELLVFFADNVALHEYLATSADLSFHAAVIVRDSRAVALVGLSTAGKTTTAIAAVRNGFRLYSDERCIIQDGRVVPFLRAITVREGGRAALLDDAGFGSAVDLRLHELPEFGDTAIRPSVLLGNRSGGPPCPLGGVFIIEGRDATPSVTISSSHAVLPALLRSMRSRDQGIDRIARALAELQAVPLYRLRLGTPAATADSIERTLDEAIAGARR